MLKNEIVTLEPADHQNVDLLVSWTLDPVAQGPYKRVPRMTAAELHDLFLHSSDRRYFLIRRTADREPLGRFYYRAWRFGSSHEMVDWELNIFVAEPNERGKGYGTAALALILGQAFHYLGLDVVHAECYLCNDSLKFWEKMGEKYRAEVYELPHRKYWQGKRWGAKFFYFTREEWEDK